MELARGHDQALAHAAVDVDAEDLEAGAAVSATASAGDALTAVEIGFDGAAVDGFETAGGVVDPLDLDAELVADDAGVGEEGLASVVGVPVGAADAGAVDPDHGVAGRGVGRGGSLDQAQVAGGVERDRVHVAVMP